MPPRITELTFLEHLAARFDLPVPGYLAAESPGAEIRAALKRWGGKALVKPDILAGKRGKAGAVRVCTDFAEAQKELKRIQSREIGSAMREAGARGLIPKGAPLRLILREMVAAVRSA